MTGKTRYLLIRWHLQERPCKPSTTSTLFNMKKNSINFFSFWFLKKLSLTDLSLRRRPLQRPREGRDCHDQHHGQKDRKQLHLDISSWCLSLLEPLGPLAPVSPGFVFNWATLSCPGHGHSMIQPYTGLHWPILAYTGLGSQPGPGQFEPYTGQTRPGQFTRLLWTPNTSRRVESPWLFSPSSIFGMMKLHTLAMDSALD